MGLFAKKVKIYEAKGKKAEWKSVKKALKDAGLKGVAGDIYQDEMTACGCGAKLDNRDFGPNGRIDRDVYAIRVLEADEEKARSIVLELIPDYQPYVPKPDRLRFI